MRGIKSLMLLLVLVAAASAFAQEDTTATKEQEVPPMGPPEQMKEVAGMVGDWHYKGEFRMDPKAESWMPQEAEIVYSLVAGGAALQMDYTGPIMGMDFHGLSLTSYDREKAEWQEIWVDNIAGRITTYTGQFEDGKLVMTGEDYYQGQPMYIRMVNYDMTDTSFKLEMESSIDGENWYVSMRGEYTRK